MLKSLTFRSGIVIALTCLLLLGLQAWMEWEAYSNQVLETKTALLNLARSLQQDAEDTIDIADTAVSGVLARLENDGITPDGLTRLSRKLVTQMGMAKRYAAIIVLGPDGDRIAGSATGEPLSSADRVYFRYHRDTPGKEPFLGPPVQSRVTGQWIITVSRRLETTNGTFAGVVIATIPLPYFVRQYATYDLGPGSSITLATTDATLLARFPSVESSVGEKNPKAPVFAYLAAQSTGTYVGTAVIDGVERISGFRRGEHYPLVVVAAMSQHEALGKWRAAMRWHMALALAMSVILALLGLYLTGQVQRSRLAEAAWRKSEEFLDHASRLAGVGAWEIELATNTVHWSAETARIHGVAPGYHPPVADAQNFYAPEARPVIAAAIAHAITHGRGWDLELPFQRADGRQLWVRTVGSAIVAEGRTVRLIGALQDITDRAVKQQALLVANERIALATSSGRIGIWDWHIVNNTMIWDTCMCQMLDLDSATDIPGYEFWCQRLHPDDRAAAERAVSDALADRGMEPVSPYETGFRVVWRDGSVHHIHSSGQVARDETGRAIRMTGASWDVSETVEQHRLLEQAHRDIQAASAKYRLLADNATDMIVVMDRNYIRRYVSPSCRDLLGYEAEDLIGKSGTLIIHPEDTARVMAAFDDLCNKPGHDRDRLTFRMRHHDGHWLWIDAVRKVLSYSDTGEPVEICCAFRDISERVAAENALRASEERDQLLLQSGAVTESVIMLDPDGNVESWNAAAERMKGYTADEIIGRHVSTFFTPEGVAANEPRLMLATARDSGQYIADAWRVHKNGGRYLAHVVVSPVYRPDGTLRGFAKVARDISSQRIEEEQRAIIIEAAPNGMMIVNETGTITLVNAQVEHLLGYPSGTLVGQPASLVVPEAFHTGYQKSQPAVRGRPDLAAAASDYTFTAYKRDGSTVSIELMSRPVKTPRGAIIVASLFDITERLRLDAAKRDADERERETAATANAVLERLARHLAKARDRADQANRAKSRFLAGMSHELRTPLNGILGHAQLLRIEGGLNNAQSARLDAMLIAGKHLLQMITRVLDLTEIEAEHIELQEVSFNLAALAEECLDLIRPAAEAKGLGVGIAVAQGAPRMLVADPTRLRQVLFNLLGNAAKFTNHGCIELRLRPGLTDDTVRIEVADTGVGIPEDQRQRLFQDFERLDTSATRTTEGAGLGLALSARLATLMGGRLGHDDNPNGGSVFWLEMPVKAPAPAAASVLHTPDALPPKRDLNVLVVDDVAMNREIARSFLLAAGHRVTCAEGGLQAVAAVASGDFDVILMDVRMPEMDGLEATRQIRALAGPCSQVPIVALTAQAFTEQVAACREAGMDGHLAKPFDMETLLNAVATATATGHVPMAEQNPPPAAATPPATLNSIPPTGGYLPVLDLNLFERTAALVPADMVATHLQTISRFGDALLEGLRKPDALVHDSDALSLAAHNLAGSGGIFGFQRLAAAGREFEQAVQSGSVEQSALARNLEVAVELTLAEIRALTELK